MAMDFSASAVMHIQDAISYTSMGGCVLFFTQSTKSQNTSQSLTWEDSAADTVADISGYENAFYYRLCGSIAKEELAGLFGKVTCLSRQGQPDDETAFLTGKMKEAQALAAEQKLGNVKILGKIRLLG